MMATLSELQSRLDTLRAARAGGVQDVRTSDGRQLTYKTDGQMAAAIADLERQIAALTTTPVTTVLVTASKGLDA
jgi:hypothetical protein